MEWDLKMPPWDLAELERDSAVRLSSGLGHQATGLDCSIDLRLGGFGDIGSSDNWMNQTSDNWTNPRPNVSKAMMISSSGSSKRARGLGNGSQIASCSVDGCISDLSKCREYHRRHKVCEIHSKTAIVMVGGREQRFCQQCSRFHLLVEFDEVKRSCRKRLDGHNRRRRKPQPDPLNCGSLITSHQGARFSSYSQIFPHSTPEPNWASGLIKTEQDFIYTHHRLPLHLMDGGQQQQQHPVHFSHGGYKEGKQFPFLPVNVESSVCQPLLKTITASSESEGLTRALDFDCALSLLSSSSYQTSGISNLSQMVGTQAATIADSIPVGQPLVPELQYRGLGLSQYSSSQASSSVSRTGYSCSGVEDEHVGNVLVSDASDADLHCHGLFHVRGEGSSDGNSPTLPFSWS